MTAERFVGQLLASSWREGTKGEDTNGRSYVLYEKDGLFLFLVNNTLVTDALYYAQWEVPVEDVVLIRTRRLYVEIETTDGSSYELAEDEAMDQVGCQG